jgi:hypothetical protein
MKIIYKTIFQICSFTILTVFIMQSVAYCKTEITGTVTAKRADLVKVEFKPHKTAGPKVGDKVDFKTIMQGLEVNAGQGEVTESESSSTWVKIKKGRPNLKMTALIHATGKPGPVEYTFEFEGSEDQISGKTYWEPGWVFRFKSVSTLTKSQGGKQLAFPEGGILNRPRINWGEFRNLQKTHREDRESWIDTHRANEVQVVWRDRKVQGLNTAFLVSQAIITNVISPMSLLRDQGFIASFRIPTPPPDKRIFVGNFYKIELTIYDEEEQYRPKYWENIFLEILKSVTIDINEN